MKLRVKRFTRNQIKAFQQRGWQHDFVQDLINNQGKTFTPTVHTMEKRPNGLIHITIGTDGDCNWNKSSHWNFDDNAQVLWELFTDTAKEVSLPEDLFTL